MFDLDLSAFSFLEDPYPTYARLRSEAPVYRHRDGFVVVSRFDMVTHILKHPKIYSSSPIGGGSPYIDTNGQLQIARGSLIGSDPPIHSRQRQVVNAPYLRSRIMRMEGHIRQKAEQFLTTFVHMAEFDLMQQMAVPLPAMIQAEILGVDYSVYEQLRRFTLGETAPEKLLENIQHVRTIAQLLTHIIAEKQKYRGDNLLSTMAIAVEEGKFTAEEFYTTASLLLVSGSEETPFLVSNAMLALLKQPETMAVVARKPSLIPKVIEETLRYDPPVQLVTRTPVCPVYLERERIEPGTVILVLLASANRDERVFPNADRFDIYRDTTSHLGFGVSIHHCLGAWLARLTSQVILELVLTRLSNIRLAAKGVKRHPTLLVRGAASLPLCFD